MTFGLLVIGSGPAGVSAAEAFREHDPHASVLIVSADPVQPYARPPLSKDFLQGETDDIDLHPPQWYRERSIELRHGVTIDRIDIEHRRAAAGDLSLEYRALVLACGAAPVPLPVPGGEYALQLRSAADATALRSAASTAKTAIVIGAGFIGCEAAASLASQGISVTLVAPESAPQVNRLGEHAGTLLRTLVEKTGVRFRGGVKVTAIQPGDAHGVLVTMQLDDGSEIAADLILAATGVAPQSGLAEDAGLEVRDSRVVVGSDMRTSAPGIYAAGDVALAYNQTAGRHLAVEHWQDADDQGSVAGAAAAGAASTWDSVPGFWSSIGDATVKYHAWGDGYQSAHLSANTDNGFTVWYTSRDERSPYQHVVGVLTHDSDENYDAGEKLIAHNAPLPTAVP